MTPNVENLAVFSVGTFRGQPKVLEYVCTRTGEILSEGEAREIGVRSIRPHAMIARTRKLDSLRKEPQAFARFILRYRNGRCGFLIPLDQLVGLYAKLHGKEIKNVRRYLPALTDAGILVDSAALHKDFMINDPSVTKAAIVGDIESAHCRFAVELLKRH
ncbi:MAG: hypothetical protein HYU74_09070 [Dechloromonas sp.]|nr:hypothetical protein [Dechloromonas sp.]